MTEEPTPCPFCEAQWVKRGDYFIHGEAPGFCPMLGASLLPRVVGEYNQMVERVELDPFMFE